MNTYGTFTIYLTVVRLDSRNGAYLCRSVIQRKHNVSRTEAQQLAAAHREFVGQQANDYDYSFQPDEEAL